MRCFFASITFLSLAAFNTVTGATEGYEILFRNAPSITLSAQDKRQIFQKMEFRLLGNQIIADEYCEDDVDPEVAVIDLNHDGVEEVFISWGNLCTSGMAGRSVNLFIKNRTGEFMNNFGFPGYYKILDAGNKGFPDLMIMATGFCHAVWQWNGSEYAFKCGSEETPGACVRRDVKKICR